MTRKKLVLIRGTVILVMLLATAHARNLVDNSGFEEQSEKSQFPMSWRKSSAYKGDISLVNDALEAYRGSCAVKVRSTGGDAAITYSGDLRVSRDREITTSVWVKGEGSFSIYFYLYGKRDFLGSVKTELADVKSEQWEKREFSIVIPIEYGPSKMNVMAFRPAFHVRKGTVYFDDVAVQIVGRKEKEPARQANGSLSAVEQNFPYFCMPKTTRPPVIDGRLDVEEWKNAAAVTGFLSQGICKLTPHQSMIYAMYDDENLYFALRSVVTGPFKKGEAGRDNIKINGEAFEIWVNPKGKQWFQFLGVPAGGFIDVSSDGDINWNGDIKYASRFEDSGETASGILTFDKTFWTAEVLIPLKELGIASPPPKGTIWRMNFCRDLAEVNGKNRTVEQWTSWSPIPKQFTDTGSFGYVEFGGDCPTVQLSGLGDPLNGLVKVVGNVNSNREEEVKLSFTVKVLATGKILAEKFLLLPVKSKKEFSLEELLKISRTTDLVLEVTAFDKEGTRRYTHSRIPFTCTSAFDVKVIPVYARKIVDIEIGTGRIPGIHEGDKVSVTIEGTGLSGEKSISSLGEMLGFRFGIEKLKPGNYIVKSHVANQVGETIVSSSVPLVIPEKPVWLGNAIGVSDKVPAPWIPIRANGREVFVTERTYLLGDNGFPEQIVSCGDTVFKGKPSVNVIVGGKAVDILFEPIRNVSSGDAQVVWEIRGRSDQLQIEGTLRIEYDGFSLYKFAIRPLAPMELDSIHVDFPVRKDVAMYARAFTYLPAYKNCSATLYKGFSSARKVDIGGKWLYNPGWIWAEEFFNSIWLGNDKIGFSLLTESDENIRGRKHIEFINGDDVTVMRLNLVSSRMTLKKPMTYEYAWQATPCVPEPKEPKKWHASYYGSWPDDYLKRLYVGAQYGTCSLSYPKLKTPVKSLLANAHRFGARVVPDFYLSSAQFNTPEYKLFGSEWEVTPRQSWGNMATASANSSYSDFLLHTAKCYVEEFGFDGVYLDVSQPVASDNPYHDAGYTDEKGKRHPTAGIWKLRELYKRLYTYLHTDGRNGVVFAHTAPLPGIVGFVDVVTAGEEWGAERERLYTRLSPDMFRAKEMHVQYGVPHTFYAFHQYSWRVSKPVPLEEVLMMTLPHRVLPTIGDRPGGKKIGAFWDLVDPWFVSSEFIPYWSPQSPVKTNSESILASIYRKDKEKQALLVVSNWGYEPAEARLLLDVSELKSEKIRLSEIYPETKAVPLENSSVVLQMKARGLKLIRMDY